MATRIVELFGYAPHDRSAEAVATRNASVCPFLKAPCTKQFRDGTLSGVCTLAPVHTGAPVICCPNRLYADHYRVLVDVAETSFGTEVRLIDARDVPHARHDGRNVAVFGKRWGRELRLPQKEGLGAFFVDWILALINTAGTLAEFVAVEVQSIDTTGTYRPEWNTYRRGEAPTTFSTAGFNWENVSKRIMPQLIYKGNVLRREKLCTKGLFFICPEPVYERMQKRLAHDMMEYHPAPGTLSFRWYNLSAASESPGSMRSLTFRGQFTTTVEQVALALTASRDLPPPGVYESAIRAELEKVRADQLTAEW